MTRNGPKTWFAAADIGATSGRVIIGRLRDHSFELEEVSRFDNGPVTLDDGLHWDADALLSHLKLGLRAADAASGCQLQSIGVDTWGVDYGRVDSTGTLLEQPFHYRDTRTQNTSEEVFAKLPPEVLYARAGLQVMPINTIFQYVAHAGDPDWDKVAATLLIPDLFSYWLCGRQVAEVTIASTTGLLDVNTRQWSLPTCEFLAEEYSLPMPRVLPPLIEPGTVLGPTSPGVLDRPISVVAVGGHDTASAVVATPSLSPHFAFISSGTWSLVGLELDTPVLSEQSRASNFTNELGVDGTVRYLKNVMGLWVLNECLREWHADGLSLSLDTLLGQVALLPALTHVIDINDDRLLPPGDMIGRVRTIAAESGCPLEADPVAITRCILDSLACAYRKTIKQACELAGHRVDVVHILGGGSKNALLCQLTAEATGCKVVAGPAEGTALGNLLVQARAMGALSGGLAELRRVAVASSQLTTYLPGALDVPQARWDTVVP